MKYKRKCLGATKHNFPNDFTRLIAVSLLDYKGTIITFCKLLIHLCSQFLGKAKGQSMFKSN